MIAIFPSAGLFGVSLALNPGEFPVYFYGGYRGDFPGPPRRVFGIAGVLFIVRHGFPEETGIGRLARNENGRLDVIRNEGLVLHGDPAPGYRDTCASALFWEMV